VRPVERGPWPVDANGDPLSLTVRRAGGFRLGYLPLASVELGVSAATLGGADPDQSMTLLGGDFQFSQGAWDFKGEYLSHQVHYGPENHPLNHGLYLQTLRSFGSWYGVARYDKFAPNEIGVANIKSAAFGAGVPVLEGSVLRCEYQTSLSGPQHNSWILQLASGF